LTEKKSLSYYKKIRKIFGGRGFGGLPLIKNVNDYALSHIHSEFANVNGHKMYLDPNDSLNLSIKEIHEPFETELVKDHVNKGEFVLDVGAHIGYYSLIMARCVGKNGKVFSFEPNPLNFNILKKNIEINEYQNIVLEEKAVSNKNGTTNLYLSKGNSGMHRIHPSKYCEDVISVDVVKLNSYFNNQITKKIRFIKIDAEGSELDVLEGLSDILKNSKIKIIMEFVPEHIIEHGSKPLDVLNFLNKYGFKIFIINEDKKKLEEIPDLKKIENNSSGTNLFCQKF
jgi:FkbM family methyltransferase